MREGLLADLTISLENALRNGSNGVIRDAYVNLYGNAPHDASVIEKAALHVWQLPPSLQADVAAHVREALAERPLTLPRPRDDALIAKGGKG